MAQKHKGNLKGAGGRRKCAFPPLKTALHRPGSDMVQNVETVSIRGRKSSQGAVLCSICNNVRVAVLVPTGPMAEILRQSEMAGFF